jgi:CMP-N-acetylneuraminic acid synthetase
MIAYVPARAGSKRIPGKNIRPLGGVPVLARVIRTLRALSFVEHIFVSTDDAEIAALSEAEQAKTLGLRDARLADDHTTLVELLKEDFPRFEKTLREPVQELLIMLPTAALVEAAVLENAYAAFRKGSTPLLLSSVPYNTSPFRALVREGDRWRPLFPERLSVRTQDQPHTCADSGLFYFMNPQVLRRHEGHWFSVPGGVQCFEVSPDIAFDVDTEKDWEALERSFKAEGR